VRILVSLLGLTVLGTSCARPRPGTDHRLSWLALAPRSYEFDFRWHCFCAGAGAWWHVIVENDRVVRATLADSSIVPRGGFVPPAGGFPTIDSVFATIARGRATRNARVDVSYDRDLHIPLTVAIDYDLDAIDDEWSMQIRNFRVRRGSG
jgi:hypothetical protein